MELTKKGIEERIKIKNDFVWYHFKNKKLDFSKIISIGGSAHLQGCSFNLSSLVSIGGFAYLYGCFSNLSSLVSIGGFADLQGCSKKLKKSLAKTLQKCDGIYVEFQDNSMTLDEFKKYADKL